LNNLHSEQSRRFRFVFPDETDNSVSVEKSPDTVSSFSDKAKQLADQFRQGIHKNEEITPALLAQFISQQNRSGKLTIRSLDFAENETVKKDSPITCLRELCRLLHLDVRIMRIWNLRKMRQGIEAEINAPDHSVPGAKVVFFHENGTAQQFEQNHISSEDERGCVRHDGRSSIVFPFDYLNLVPGRNRTIVFPGFEVPLGGLYLHYYCVYSSERWNLEYCCAKGDFCDAGVRVVNLLPDSKLSLDVHRDIFMVHVQPDSYGRSAFLLIADKTIVPESVFAIPEKIENQNL